MKKYRNLIIKIMLPVISICILETCLLDAEAADKEELNKSIIKTKVYSASADNPNYVLGEFSTDYDQSKARAINVERAADLIDGTVLQPDELFSYNTVVGERTKENGFVSAPAYAGGKVVKSTGGGICQTATTLFDASLLAGFIPTDRQCHSQSVHYVDAGLDAGIAWGTKDFCFVNTLDIPITIHMTYANGTITASISASEENVCTYKPVVRKTGKKSTRTYLLEYDKYGELIMVYSIGNSSYKDKSVVSEENLITDDELTTLYEQEY